MNQKTLDEQVRRHMAAADPAAHITDQELAASRERSLRTFQTAATSPSDQISPTGSLEYTPTVVSLSAKRKRRTRKWVTSLAAAAVLAALVAGDIVGLAGWRGSATADAAEVLNTAAETAITSADPVVNPGQYLRVKSTNVWSTETWTEDGSKYQWLDTEKMDMYIPTDRTAEWVWLRSGRVPTTFFDDKARNYVLEQGIQAHSETLRAPKGEFYGQPGGILTTDMSVFPRDPYRLLNHIYIRTLGAGQSVDGEALVFIADLLRTGLVPADLRAALYKAAAMIPGVTITEGQANLDGRTGVAIGRTEGTLSRQEIIIDPKTGQLIGERQVLTTDYGAMKAGTPIAWTAVETSVSDTAP
ncbi:CU044_5270 family protein [Arthrobacter sp. ISL-72]|uniref:CU044_5270 family protein n=1 Tax=Arthrobacter sp. ISL-72 TaxID=2819114 RepID=UPI001BEC03FB|nr:CU044_5270 family protein [Arthrobacter sp. ISL-72]MBT2598110.1 CU044_5270 family protein [Arthrobacter sp. ISL-72]